MQAKRRRPTRHTRKWRHTGPGAGRAHPPVTAIEGVADGELCFPDRTSPAARRCPGARMIPGWGNTPRSFLHKSLGPAQALPSTRSRSLQDWRLLTCSMVAGLIHSRLLPVAAHRPGQIGAGQPARGWRWRRPRAGCGAAQVRCYPPCRRPGWSVPAWRSRRAAPSGRRWPQVLPPRRPPTAYVAIARHFHRQELCHAMIPAGGRAHKDICPQRIEPFAVQVGATGSPQAISKNDRRRYRK